MIALIDEATGYRKARAKNALQIEPRALIADDLQDWALMFPQALSIELARLGGPLLGAILSAAAGQMHNALCV